MSQVPVKWAVGLHLEDKQTSICQIPVVPLSALLEQLNSIIGQAHGGAMLGGDDAYQACLAIETKAQRLLASLGEVGT